MRRRVLGVVVLASIAALLAACGKPAGVDGNLTNGWPALPEAKIAVPTAPACYTISQGDPTEVTKWPPSSDCATSHSVETIAVGAFAGSDGDRTTPPPSGSPGRRKAYEDCAAQAKTYLGDDWRAGRMDLFLVTPIPLHWEAGARWYRCDIMEYKDLEDYTTVQRVGSAKGALAAAGDLRLGCLTVTTTAASDIDKMLPVTCTTPHNGEFAGVWEAPDGTYPVDATARKTQNLAGCKGIIATYTGIPNDSNFQYRTGWVGTPFNKASWELGNRGVRCYIWLNKNISNSLKGVGTSGLPINYG